MELRDSHRYAAPIATVIAMLGDKSATVEKYESMGHRNVEILELEADADVLRVKTTRASSTSTCPASRRKR